MILNDLDDFILPSQVCINPLVATANTTEGTQDEVGVGGVVRLDVSKPDISSLAYEMDPTPVSVASGVIKSKKKDDVKIATISLSDCLACR